MDLTILWIVLAILIHWVADFVLQPGDLQTDQKAEYIIKHCNSYTISFSLLSLLLWIAINKVVAINTLNNFAAFLLICVLSHAIIDYMLIPVLYKYKKQLRMLGLAWALDQIIHISIVVAALYYFLL